MFRRWGLCAPLTLQCWYGMPRAHHCKTATLTQSCSQRCAERWEPAWNTHRCARKELQTQSHNYCHQNKNNKRHPLFCCMNKGNSIIDIFAHVSMPLSCPRMTQGWDLETHWACLVWWAECAYLSRFVFFFFYDDDDNHDGFYVQFCSVDWLFPLSLSNFVSTPHRHSTLWIIFRNQPRVFTVTHRWEPRCPVCVICNCIPRGLTTRSFLLSLTAARAWRPWMSRTARRYLVDW